MAFNLIDSVKGLFGKDLISKASATLGEDENKVTNAVSGIVPSVLAGILNKAGSGDARLVLSMAKDTAHSDTLTGMGNFLGNSNLLSRGADLLKGLFGDRTTDVANMISAASGIRTASATSLMSMAAPAALGALGKHAEATHMNEGGLLSFLSAQKDKILNALPSGFNLAAALGLSSIGNIGSKLSGALSGITGQVKGVSGILRKKSSIRWLLPIVLGLAAVALLVYFLVRRTPANENVPAATEIKTAAPTVAAPSAAINIMLPNGVQITANKGGIEDQLVGFLKDPTRPVDNNLWFDFDNLNFETGSSTITPQSMGQIINLTSILKAFPAATIKIGGYTDKMGSEPANIRLSQARANAVVTALMNNGIKSAQLAGAEGYGSKFAKAAATAPDEERRQDRRISVSVRAK